MPKRREHVSACLFSRAELDAEVEDRREVTANGFQRYQLGSEESSRPSDTN